MPAALYGNKLADGRECTMRPAELNGMQLAESRHMATRCTGF